MVVGDWLRTFSRNTKIRGEFGVSHSGPPDLPPDIKAEIGP